jgi:transcriptional regulator with GAF, ATPase, and Fis domain
MGNEKIPSSKTVPLDRERPKARTHNVSIIFYHDDGVEAALLEPESSLTVGRSPESDIVVKDPSLSRRHARFYLTPAGEVRVEDLQSTNGTHVNGELVADAAVRPGDEVVLGNVTVAIRSTEGSEEGRPFGLCGNDRFRTLLEEEVVRNQYFGRPLVVWMIRTISPTGSHVRHWLPRVQDLFRPVDRAGLYSQETILVSLPEMTQEQVVALAAKAIEQARPAVTLGCGVVEAAPGRASADKLIEAARALARSATETVPLRVAELASTRAVAGADAGAPIAESEPMRAVLKMAAKLARGVVPVLLSGETGTGKEVVARFIHESSARNAGPLVCLNCAAIPDTLVESTLFGHERGAFTGAGQIRKGVFEAASGGTILLDEIGELSSAAQAVLLRVLETKRVMRVGATKEIDVDIRVIAATHRDLEAMVGAGTFRRDLLYRVNAMPLKIPPLRERRSDIRPLAVRFLLEASLANGRHIETFEDDAMEALERYAWPGNVRELKNAIERAVVIAQESIITSQDLPERVAETGDVRPLAITDYPPPPEPAGSAAPAGAGSHFRSAVERFERDFIAQTLRECDGNQTAAARIMAMPLRTLVYKIRRYGIRVTGLGSPE